MRSCRHWDVVRIKQYTHKNLNVLLQEVVRVSEMERLVEQDAVL